MFCHQDLLGMLLNCRRYKRKDYYLYPLRFKWRKIAKIPGILLFHAVERSRTTKSDCVRSSLVFFSSNTNKFQFYPSVFQMQGIFFLPCDDILLLGAMCRIMCTLNKTKQWEITYPHIPRQCFWLAFDNQH